MDYRNIALECPWCKKKIDFGVKVSSQNLVPYVPSGDAEGTGFGLHDTTTTQTEPSYKKKRKKAKASHQ